MASGQKGYKVTMPAALLVVLALWVNVAIAGAHENALLLDAAERGNWTAVKGFISKGADVNAKSNDGATALEYASLDGQREVVQLLLDKGADVNTRSNDSGSTPLIDAAGYNHKEVVQLLLARGAHVNAKDKAGRTALLYAIGLGCDKEVVKLLLAKGADVNVKAKSGSTALGLASAFDRKEIMELLIKAGAK